MGGENIYLRTNFVQPNYYYCSNSIIIYIYYFIYFLLEETISRYISLTESEFESITSEWLRFAKQRKERCDKTKEKQQDNE